MTTPTYRVSGLTLQSDFPLTGLHELPVASEPDVQFSLSSTAELERVWSGSLADPALWRTVLPDGCEYSIERGRAGDHRIAYGERARFHVTGDAATVLCDPTTIPEPAWQRFLLDTVLYSVSLLRGHEALHASAVAVDEGALAIVAATGTGKTTLAAELLARGRALVCDDVLILGRDHGAIRAHPGPPLMNVPSDEPPAFGTPLAKLDDEYWIAVDTAASEPLPVASVCFLERRSEAAPRIESVAITGVDLLAHALPSGRGSDRLTRRFELFCDLAEQVSAMRLVAGRSTPASDLADLVEGALAPARSEVG